MKTSAPARHTRKCLTLLTLLIAVLNMLGCTKTDDTTAVAPGEKTRSFALGFTAFPSAKSMQAVNAAWDVIANDGDMAVLHLDEGVPWQEALAAAQSGVSYTQTYATDYLASLNFKASKIPTGHVVYLAVTPLAFLRDGLAAHRGSTTNEPLTAPWSTYALDDPAVISAFTAHCENMIAAFAPDYFAYAIEANILYQFSPSQWPAFVELARAVYTSLKASHPQLPIFITLQASFYHADPSGQTAAIAQILPYTDFIAISGYPYTDDSDPLNLPDDYFSALTRLAPNKPFAVTETGWPAEDIMSVDETTLLIPASEAAQKIYVERLLSDADKLSARFVSWFLTRDYDDFWESDFKALPNATLIRTWRDTGLYDGTGQARPALASWRESLALTRKND